jgi:hypothetical protein
MGKTRAFTGAPLDWSIVVRKYLLSFIRLMQNNRFIFEAAPGTIAQSLEWQKIREFLTKHGEDRMIAGDYASFDKSMPPCIILASYKVIYNICKEAGYSDDDLKVVWGIAEDTAYPLVDFNGDLIEFFGSNPSGHPLTVIVNSLANSLYMRYCYSVLSPDNSCEDFQKNVSLMTYGDDNVMGVSDKTPWFNHTAIQNTLHDVGIKYTMADKEAISIPYINISQVSFLKRTWRYDNDMKVYLAPLDHESIEKMLLITVKSKTISPEAQATAIVSSAMNEYFFYGKKTFNEKRDLLMNVIEKCDLQFYVTPSTFPTWEELSENFWNNSKHVE